MFKYVIISCIVFSTGIHAGKAKQSINKQSRIAAIKKALPKPDNGKQKGPDIIDVAADGTNAVHLQDLPGNSASNILYILTGNRD